MLFVQPSLPLTTCLLLLMEKVHFYLLVTKQSRISLNPPPPFTGVLRLKGDAFCSGVPELVQTAMQSWILLVKAEYFDFVQICLCQI